MTSARSSGDSSAAGGPSTISPSCAHAGVPGGELRMRLGRLALLRGDERGEGAIADRRGDGPETSTVRRRGDVRARRVALTL